MSLRTEEENRRKGSRRRRRQSLIGEDLNHNEIMMTRPPNRSDEHLPPEEEARREEETREYFDGVTPKRHTKPQRSEYSSSYTDHFLPTNSDSIPELDKFRDLESHPDKLVYNGSEPSDEFVETEYYKDLNCVDKQHHKTGTGFIKVDKPSSDDKCFHLETDTHCICHPSCKGNPATSDWIPSADNNVIPISNKPSRSDI